MNKDGKKQGNEELETLNNILRKLLINRYSALKLFSLLEEAQTIMLQTNWGAFDWFHYPMSKTSLSEGINKFCLLRDVHL